MIGWLLDTNVISTIINPNGAPTVKAWAAAQLPKAVTQVSSKVIQDASAASVSAPLFDL